MVLLFNEGDQELATGYRIMSSIPYEERNASLILKITPSSDKARNETIAELWI